MNATLLSLMLLTLAGNAFALTVGISAKTDGNEKPTVIGSTNLPDAVELMITLSRTGSAYMAQDKAKVVQGTFRAGPFSQKGSALNPGTYKLEVSMPIAAVQPPVTWLS